MKLQLSVDCGSYTSGTFKHYSTTPSNYCNSSHILHPHQLSHILTVLSLTRAQQGSKPNDMKIITFLVIKQQSASAHGHTLINLLTMTSIFNIIVRFPRNGNYL